MKSILIATFIAILSLLPFYNYGQFYHLYGDKTFGGNLDEYSGNLIVANNMELIISGNSFTNVNGDKVASLCNTTFVNQTDAWFLKIDTAFNILWQKDIGGDHIEDSFYIMKSDVQSQFFFSCRSASDSSCDKSENNRSYPSSTLMDYWIALLDSNGNKLWDKTYGTIIGVESGGNIIKLTSGEYIVGGISSGGINGDKTVNNYGLQDYWLVKMDSIGNKIWDNVYGGTGPEVAPTRFGENDILANDDGTFILGGTTSSPISGSISDSSRGGNDFWIIKIDSSGNKIWDRRFGGDQNDFFYDINYTKDNGFVLCGYTSSSQSGEVSQPSIGGKDFWIVKIDSLGNKIWDKRFGGIGTERAVTIEEDFDGGYWVGGEVTSGISGDVSESAYGSSDYWILKLDSLGNKIWDKRFGGPGYNFLTNFTILADSTIMLFGYADSGESSVKTDIGKGESDYWLVHFYYGNNPVGISENINSQALSIYPNPASEEVTFAFNSTRNKIISIFDISGKQIGHYSVLKSTTIDISQLSSGVYICKVIDGDKGTFVRKILKY